MCLAKMREAIDACAEFGFPNVITFTGLAGGIAPDEGARNCVAGYKRIAGYAEKKKVNLCLEILNSRVPIEMVGVPGYQGDHTDYCMEIIKKVSSPRMKLLFDIFHVQIMDGDIIARIREYQDYIGHGRQPRSARTRRYAGDQLPSGHEGHRRDRLHRLHRTRIHANPRST